MKRVFADAQFFIALINVRDQSRRQVVAAGPSLRGTTLVTTEEVLTEVLAFFAERGRHLRELAAASVEKILAEPGIIVLAQSHESFLDGFAFYKSRPDKGYSLTDSISMITMRREGITEILTHDGHFAQEGFRTLL